ncbi:polyketide cyclase [Sphingobacteriaceae bacterium]|nr:polyketide cyclase [Sphingobacteriaceae bacterium]
MADSKNQLITVATTVNAPIDKVWNYWTEPQHILHWNNASPDWHTPKSENDLREGGKFSSTMAARDGSMSFDFGGTYTKVELHKKIEYTLEDDRKVKINFTEEGQSTKIVEDFEAENQNSIELQKSGWQAIIDNFKKYTEEN